MITQRRGLLLGLSLLLNVGACSKKPPPPPPAPPVTTGSPSTTAAPEKPAAATVDLSAYREALKKGRNLAKKSDLPGAIAAFTEALKVKPKDGAALSELGYTQLMSKDYEHARATSEEAVAQAATPPLKAASLYNLGRAEEELGHKEAAIAAYRGSILLRDNSVVRARLKKLGGDAGVVDPRGAGGDGEFTLPCDKTLKLGLEKFSETYQDKNDDHSENAEDQAAMHFAECLQKSSQPRLTALPPDKRASILNLRQALGDFAAAFYAVEFFGGTMARHEANRSGVLIESMIGSILDGIDKPASPSLQPKAAAELKRLRQVVKESSSQTYNDDEFEKARFTEEAKSLKAALATLEKTLKPLPPQALDQAIDYLHSFCSGECK